jgi:hypothetical protein
MKTCALIEAGWIDRFAPTFAEVEEGDWGTWTSARYGITMTVRVESYTLDGRWQVGLKLREISADVYDGVLAEGSATGSAEDWSQTTPPIDTGAPDSANWSLAAVTLSDTAGIDTPALEITGDSTDDDSAEVIEFGYWKDDGVIDPTTDPDDPTWSVFGTLPPSTTKVDITGIEGGADYYAYVRYYVSGAPGDRLVLGPVTAGSTDVSGAVDPLIDAKTALLSWKQPVRAKTTAALAANTYANGTSGVGATLTGNANGALAAQDGVTLVANERLLVANEATGSHNGIYTVTQVGDASHPYILTRTTDADTGAKLVNATCKVSEGTAAADQEWQCTTNAAITVGTTALVWAAVGGDVGDALVAGTNISITDNGDGTYTIASSAGGGTGWTLAGSWTWSTNVASVPIIGLGGYNELLIHVSGVSASASGVRRVCASVDNGTSYFSASGDYTSIIETGVEGVGTGWAHSTASTSARGMVVHVLNTKGAKKVASVTAQSLYSTFVASSSDINAIRLDNSGGGNLTSGSMLVFGR